MVMPEMSGGEIFDELKKINPLVKVLLSSGYSLNGQASRIIKRGCVGFIQKPFTIRDIASQLREIIDKQKTVSK
jgi:DNA-binding NtrC family response regulator